VQTSRKERREHRAKVWWQTDIDYGTGESSPGYLKRKKNWAHMVSFFPVTGLLYSTAHNLTGDLTDRISLACNRWLLSRCLGWMLCCCSYNLIRPSGRPSTQRIWVLTRDLSANGVIPHLQFPKRFELVMKRFMVSLWTENGGLFCNSKINSSRI